MEITENNSAKVVVFGGEYQQDTVKFGTADTKTEGQLLGRKYIADAVAVVVGATNTGNGVLDAQVLGSNAVAKVGIYTVECTVKITNSGKFKLVDPDGIILDNNLVIPVSGTLSYNNHGLSFDLADGTTDFEVADEFTLTTAADGALTDYDRDGLDGSAKIIAVICHTRTVAVAASVADRVLIKGELNLDIVEAASGITLSQAEKDAMKAIGLILRPVTDNAIYDNS